MRRVILDQSQLAEFDELPNCVHYNGAAIISNMTLCGAVDWVGAEWIETTKRVNCPGCIGVRNHVLGKSK